MGNALVHLKLMGGSREARLPNHKRKHRNSNQIKKVVLSFATTSRMSNLSMLMRILRLKQKRKPQQLHNHWTNPTKKKPTTMLKMRMGQTTKMKTINHGDLLKFNWPPERLNTLPCFWNTFLCQYFFTVLTRKNALKSRRTMAERDSDLKMNDCK